MLKGKKKEKEEKVTKEKDKVLLLLFVVIVFLLARVDCSGIEVNAASRDLVVSCAYPDLFDARNRGSRR